MFLFAAFCQADTDTAAEKLQNIKNLENAVEADMMAHTKEERIKFLEKAIDEMSKKKKRQLIAAAGLTCTGIHSFPVSMEEMKLVVKAIHVLEKAEEKFHMTMHQLFDLGYHMIFHGFKILSESEQIRVLKEIGMECTKQSRRLTRAFDKNAAVLRNELVRVEYLPGVDLDVAINNAFSRAAAKYNTFLGERRRVGPIVIGMAIGSVLVGATIAVSIPGWGRRRLLDTRGMRAEKAFAKLP